MKQQRDYPSVQTARMQGNTELLKSLGRLGGIRNGVLRRKEKESRERLEALERGSIAPPLQAKKRPTMTIKRYLALRDWSKDPESIGQVAHEREEMDKGCNFDICPID